VYVFANLYYVYMCIVEKVVACDIYIYIYIYSSEGKYVLEFSV
jgi:hypothetical protein